MVAIAAGPIAGLMMVAAYITDPALSPTVFNNWYSNIHVRDMINNKFASIAIRYIACNSSSISATPNFLPSSKYLALYNVPDIDFVNEPGNMDKLPLASDMLPDKTQPVMAWSSWDFTYWLHVQSYEGKSIATERSKFVVMNKIEPARGGEDDLDQWYRKENLDKLSAIPGYRRTTRFKSSDGSKPRYVALHEVDDLAAFVAASDSLNTDWAKKIRTGASIFEVTTWQLFLDKGNSAEKLGD